MGCVKSLAAGVAGGAAGAIAWGAIVHFTNYEIGWIAWGIGALVGAMMLGASSGQRRVSRGVAAAVVALLSIFAGKYIAAYWEVHGEVVAARARVISDTDIKLTIASKLVEEAQDQGKTLTWPSGKDADSAEEPPDYPPDIWAQAQTDFDAMLPADRETRRDEIKRDGVEKLEKFGPLIALYGAVISIGWMDALWAVLAVGSAFRLSVGTRSAPAEEQPSEAPAEDQIA